MKTEWRKCAGLMLLIIATILPARLSAQSAEAQQLLLNVEKLSQFKQILKDMKDGYDILSKGYKTIKDISEGNFDIHEAFLDGLLAVSPQVRKYKKITEIITMETRLVRTYTDAQSVFFRSGSFSIAEINYLNGVYNNLFKQSLRNLGELMDIITSGKFRMSDDERIEAIDRIHADMSDKSIFLKSFNANIAYTAMSNAKAIKDIETLKLIYGLQ